MAEVNLLTDFVSLVQSRSGRQVTIVAPTPWDEQRLAFDELFEGLPSGRVLALQFKRPLETATRYVVKYTMDVIQQVKLTSGFGHREAFYALVPYPTVALFIADRTVIMDTSAAVDAHDIPNPGKVLQKTRTIYYNQLRPSGFTVRVTDPYPEVDEAEAESFTSLAQRLADGKVGREVKGVESRNYRNSLPDKPKPLRMRKLYFVHVSLSGSQR